MPIWTEGYWGVLTTPGSEAYHSLWGPLLLMELFGNSAFIVAAAVLLVLLFKKSQAFPKMMIIYMLSNLAFVSLDYYLGGLIPAVAELSDGSAMQELLRSMLGAAIWIPYFLKSERVKNTFVNSDSPSNMMPGPKLPSSVPSGGEYSREV